MQREACQILHTGCNKAAKTNQSKPIKRGGFLSLPFLSPLCCSYLFRLIVSLIIVLLNTLLIF